MEAYDKVRMEKRTIIVMMTVAFVALTTISEINSASLRRKKNAPPSDPWQLFNISIRANGNKSEGMLKKNFFSIHYMNVFNCFMLKL